MSRLRVIASFALALSTLTVDSPWAATTVNVLTTEPSYSGCDDPAFDWIDASDCAALTSVPRDGDVFVWVVVSDDASFPQGIGGVQFATTHSMDIDSWVLCTGGNEIPGDGWPESGAGNAVTWESGCYEPMGGNARVGFFAIADGSSGIFGIEPDPRTGAALWVECDGDDPIPICSEGLGLLDLALGGEPVCGTQPGGFPDAATNCVATDGACEIEVSWEHPGGDVTSFAIDRDGTVVGTVSAGERSYVDTSAARGVSYTYSVITTNSCGSAPPSNVDVGDRAPLPAPTDVTASDDVCEGILVSWTYDMAWGATAFDVRRNGVHAATVDAAAREFLDTAIAAGSSSQYTVTPVDDCGDGDSSAEVTGTRPRLPFAPTQCRATDDRCLAVIVTWADRSTDEIGFEVRRDGVTLATTDPDVESFADDTAVPDVEYAYDVVAVSECGGSVSNQNAGMRISTPPAATSGLTATHGLCGEVRLTWVDNSPDETGFLVRRDGDLIATAEPNVTAYVDATGTPDVTYTYTVVPTNACGEAVPTEDAAGSAGSDPPTAATGCSASDTNCEVVIVAWVDTSDDESAFDVVRDGDVIATVGAGVTTYADTSAEADLVYEYAVVARNACGSAPASGSDQGMRPNDTPLSAPVLDLPADGAECIADIVTFAWRSVAGADAYRIRAGSACGEFDLINEVTSDTTVTRRLSGELVHWSVATRNACETFGDASACWTFTTEPSLDAPELRAEDTEVEGFWHFEWDPVSVASRYILVTNGFECHDPVDATRYTVAGTDTTLDMSEYYREPYGIQFYAWLLFEVDACDAASDSSACAGPGEGVPVRLDYFTASAEPGSVVLEWRTVSERDVLGFRLTRTDGDAAAVDVTEDLVTPGRTTYRVVDDAVSPGREYAYRLLERRTSGRDVVLDQVVTRTPEAFGSTWLSPLSPNPFNPSASMTVRIDRAADVRLAIFDASGRHVRTLLSGRLPAGELTLTWDGRDDWALAVGSGTYFARLEAGGARRVRRVVLIR